MVSSTDNCSNILNNPEESMSQNDSIQCEYKSANSTILPNQNPENNMLSNNGLSAYKPTDQTNLKKTPLGDPPRLPSEEDQASENTSEKPQVMYVQKFYIVLVNNPNTLKRTSKQNFIKIEGSVESYVVGSDTSDSKKLHINELSESELTEKQLQQSNEGNEISRQGRRHSVKELKQYFENSGTNNLHKKKHNSISNGYSYNSISNGYSHNPSLRKIKEEAKSSGKYHQIKQSFEDPTSVFSPQSMNSRGRFTGSARRNRSNLSYEELEEADAILIEEMSAALERGDIVEVAKIVDSNPHLVNVVPPKIGLGPLHQAALKGEVNIVNKLLYYPASNPNIKTTASRNNVYGAGKTAEELTDREDVRKAIQKKKHELSKDYSKCPTLVDISDSNLILMDYTSPSIEKERGTICSENFQSESFKVFTKMMEDVFLYAHYTSNWEKVREVICGELIKFDNPIAQNMKKLETRESFYNNLLKLYTSKTVFKIVNEELRNQAVKEVRKFNLRNEFSVYAAIVSSILFVWEDLQPYTEVTYRGMNIEKEDLDKYSVGTEFAWLSFVSSSSDQKVAKRFGTNSLFIFDNKERCKWSPKSIENMSDFKKEKEYLYPCGAQFKVTKVEPVDSITHIYIELICTVDPTPARSLFDETVENTNRDIETVDGKVKQFGIDLNELKETVQTANETQDNENNEVHKEEEIKKFLSKMEDDKCDIKSLLKGIKENIKLLNYGLTGGESIGKNLLNKIFRNTNNEKQRNEIKHLKEKVRPIKKLMKKHGTSFIETSEFARENVF